MAYWRGEIWARAYSLAKAQQSIDNLICVLVIVYFGQSNETIGRGARQNKTEWESNESSKLAPSNSRARHKIRLGLPYQHYFLIRQIVLLAHTAMSKTSARPFIQFTTKSSSKTHSLSYLLILHTQSNQLH